MVSFGEWSAILSVLLAVVDFGTDIYSAVIYWRHTEDIRGGYEIAIFATASVSLGFLPLIICLLLVCVSGIEKSENPVRVCRMIESIVESLPQLWLTSYALSVSLEQEYGERIFLYISSAVSLVSSCVVFYKVDDTFESEDVSYVKRAIEFTLRTVMLLARMFVLVYMTVQIGWWTVAFIGSHWLLISAVICCMYACGSPKCCASNASCGKEVCKGISSGIFFAMVFIFSWISMGAFKKSMNVTFTLLFAMEHIAGWLSSWYLGRNMPFYLFENVLLANVVTNGIGIFLMVIYLCCGK